MSISFTRQSQTRHLARSSLETLAVLIVVLLTAEVLSGQIPDDSLTITGDSISVPDESSTTEEESATETESDQNSGSEANWYKRIQLSADFRSRYEGFYQTDREARNRFRFRFRLRVDTEINEDARFQLQIASGDPGTPVSTNQTFTSFFRPKPFSLDRAYLAYNPQAASALTLGVGKFGFPQNRTQLIFDNDLNFEGSWEQVSWDLTDGVEINLVALQTVVSEVSRDADAYMLAGFSELRVAGDRADVSISAANYRWTNPHLIAAGQVNGPLRSVLTNELSRDNQGQVVGYASGFNVVDVIAEAEIDTGRAGYPMRLLANFAHNTLAANDRDSGLWFEAQYGRPRLVHTWGAGYTYGWIEQDVTPSAFMFSDIPGTNIRLHMIETSYVPKSGLSFDVALHLTKRLEVVDAIPNERLARLHVAVVARF